MIGSKNAATVFTRTTPIQLSRQLPQTVDAIRGRILQRCKPAANIYLAEMPHLADGVQA
jgi:hypothetical protein